MPFALHPLSNPALVFRETVADEILCRVAIRVGGSRRNLRLAAKPFAQLSVGPANVLLQRMPALFFICRQVARPSMMACTIIWTALAAIRRGAGTGATGQ